MGTFGPFKTVASAWLLATVVLRNLPGKEAPLEAPPTRPEDRPRRRSAGIASEASSRMGVLSSIRSVDANAPVTNW